MPESSQTAITDALQGEDELGAVIRAHILVESQLLRLFELMIPHQEHLEDIRLSYRQRVDLALALGLKPQYGAPLKKFGSIRNDFAHKPDASLTQKHVTDLYGALHETDREVVLKAFEATKRKMPGTNAQTFKKLEPKDRFILIVVSLHAVLVAAVMQIERGPNAV